MTTSHHKKREREREEEEESVILISIDISEKNIRLDGFHKKLLVQEIVSVFCTRVGVSYQQRIVSARRFISLDYRNEMPPLIAEEWS